MKLFTYHWPSRKAEMLKVLAADPQVAPPHPCQPAGGEVVKLSGIDRELLEEAAKQDSSEGK